jgi:KaiC/GvpD/RAD55 family RecA-like ATPase
MASQAVNKVPLGIPGLDENLGGGVPKGCMIMLAGEPGTGKTTFAAQFLYRGAVDHGERGVYVSFVEDKATFFNNMRGLGFDFEGLEGEGKFRFLEMLTVREAGVPETLNLILKEIIEFKAQRLVLDSFTALAQAIREVQEVRVLLQSFLSRMIKSRECTTIIITEKPYGVNRVGTGVEEFIADCVILLKRGWLDQRPVRELEVLKARGMAIAEPQLLFTIRGGLKAFKPFKHVSVEQPRRFEPVPDSSTHFSTGIKDLDEVLGGGYPKGSMVLIEVDEKASMRYDYIILPTMWNFLAQSRGVFIIPPPGVEYTTIRDAFALGGFKEGELEGFVRIFIREVAEARLGPCVHPVGGKDFESDLLKYDAVGRELRKRSGRGSTLYIFGMDTIADWYGERGAYTAIRVLASVAKRGNHLGVMLLKPGTSTLLKLTSAIADVQLRVTREHGCVLVYGVKPRTPIHVMELDTSEGYPMPKLTPIA